MQLFFPSKSDYGKENQFYVNDSSPDIKNQMLNNNIKNLSHVIYTHEHADQTNGLFELRPFFWKDRKKICSLSR